LFIKWKGIPTPLAATMSTYEVEWIF
jgi:hypothetical protein